MSKIENEELSWGKNGETGGNRPQHRNNPQGERPIGSVCHLLVFKMQDYRFIQVALATLKPDNSSLTPVMSISTRSIGRHALWHFKCPSCIRSWRHYLRAWEIARNDEVSLHEEESMWKENRSMPAQKEWIKTLLGHQWHWITVAFMRRQAKEIQLCCMLSLILEGY